MIDVAFSAVLLWQSLPRGSVSSAVRGAAVLQFRAEFFNLFNVVNFALPMNVIRGTGFGIINKTAGTSRQIQFSLRLIF